MCFFRESFSKWMDVRLLLGGRTINHGEDEKRRERKKHTTKKQYATGTHTRLCLSTAKSKERKSSNETRRKKWTNKRNVDRTENTRKRIPKSARAIKCNSKNIYFVSLKIQSSIGSTSTRILPFFVIVVVVVVYNEFYFICAVRARDKYSGPMSSSFIYHFREGILCLHTHTHGTEQWAVSTHNRWIEVNRIE